MLKIIEYSVLLAAPSLPNSTTPTPILPNHNVLVMCYVFIVVNFIILIIIEKGYPAELSSYFRTLLLTLLLSQVAWELLSLPSIYNCILSGTCFCLDDSFALMVE